MTIEYSRPVPKRLPRGSFVPVAALTVGWALTAVGLLPIVGLPDPAAIAIPVSMGDLELLVRSANPPPVRHLYTRSSLQQIAEGGYEVQLDASWEARVTVTTSTGQSESFTIPGARTNVYSARHAVRESQAIVGQAR